MSWREDEQRAIVQARGGSNEPLWMKPATYDGHRSVRIAMLNGDVGLATATYSYKLTHDERCDVAERIAALWNLAAAKGWSTAFILAAIAKAEGRAVPPHGSGP